MPNLAMLKRLIQALASLALLFLTGCNSTALIDAPLIAVPANINGTWISRCEFNAAVNLYEIVEYDINQTRADVFISRYNDFRCRNLVEEEYYEGDVSQSGAVVLGNGLNAVRLSFSLYDAFTGNSLSYSSFFNTDPFFLYEYPNSSGQSIFEYTRF